MVRLAGGAQAEQGSSPNLRQAALNCLPNRAIVAVGIFKREVGECPSPAWPEE